eukprot:GHRQ01033566.1.p1 GENE.GHRQ01033566.1~~GHRQ01033566.1.p1  ORF type:complete len:183 (+),score=55.05 GHRQ01033566.1:735-1283(+)
MFHILSAFPVAPYSSSRHTARPILCPATLFTVPCAVPSCPMQGPDAPAGLRNLGNTCYVNAAMQFLQAIPEFRRALYVLEPELAEQDVIRQLRDLFIELHFGPRRYVDPEPFANSLQLNHAVQQVRCSHRLKPKTAALAAQWHRASAASQQAAGVVPEQAPEFIPQPAQMHARERSNSLPRP